MRKNKNNKGGSFVRVVDLAVFRRIPRRLFEQVRGRSWSVDRLYEFAPVFLADETNNYFWIFESDRRIEGILWAVIDALSEKLNVIVCSGIVPEDAHRFLRRFTKDFNAANSGIALKEKINWLTTQPEMFNKMGGNALKTVMVEV